MPTRTVVPVSGETSPLHKKHRGRPEDNLESAAPTTIRTKSHLPTNIRGRGGRIKGERNQQLNTLAAELKVVPPQPLILKNGLMRSKKGSSRYTGVYFEKAAKKWRAQIMIEGKVRMIGKYENEEDAAADYARAAFRYKKAKQQKEYGGLDLSGIPDQELIRNEKAQSGYRGVKRNKKRWEARINNKNLGTYDSKEEAAAVYARARYYYDHQEGGRGATSKERMSEAEGVPDGSIDVVFI
jgi:hypothetical protein